MEQGALQYRNMEDKSAGNTPGMVQNPHQKFYYLFKSSQQIISDIWKAKGYPNHKIINWIQMYMNVTSTNIEFVSFNHDRTLFE